MSAVSNSEVILHIGVPKTGTTALQAYLYENRDLLGFRHSLIYPETLLDNFDPADQYAHHLYAHKWGGWLDAPRFQTPPDEAWRRLGERIRHEPGRYVISSERFADIIPTPRGESILQFVREAVAPARLRVLGYVRRQDTLAESFLRQTIKVNLLEGTVSDYAADLPPFFDFDLLFSSAASVVGWENVTVRPYEKKHLTNASIVHDFTISLGIERAPEPRPRKAGDDPAANESISSITALSFLDLKRNGFVRDPDATIRGLRHYYSQPLFDPYAEYYLIDTDVRRQIIRKYSSANLALAEKLGQPDWIADLIAPDGDLPRSLAEAYPHFNEFA